MTAGSPLSSLAVLLSSNVQILESMYEAQGLVFPSLDDCSSVSQVVDTPEAIHASRIIVACAAQILATVRMPMETIQEMSSGPYASAALGLTVDIHVPNILNSAGDKGMHVDRIAKQTDVPADTLGRLLRYLATRHVFREVEPDTYANNRLSSLLIKQRSIEEIKENSACEFDGSPAAAFVGHASDECTKGALAIPAWIKGGFKNYAAPFNMGNHTDQDLFGWYATDQRRSTRFHIAMTGASKWFPRSDFIEGFDWNTLERGATVVDVGGGIGAITRILLEEFPHFQYVVQDKEDVIGSNALAYWRSQVPSALSDGQVMLQGIDFFIEQPIEGAAVYFMRAILHDWPDAKCHQILRILRRASSPSSRLVVFERVVSHACRYDGPFSGVLNPVPAPYPLLENFGMGSGGLVTFLDMQMLTLFNGKERTIREFIALGEKTGWKLSSVKPGKVASLVFAPV